MIKTFNDLKRLESMLQVDILKGFKCLDRTGEIVNKYVTEDLIPFHKKDENGIFIINPKESISELRISPTAVWAKFLGSKTLDFIKQVFSSEARNIMDIIEIKEINRIGWRNYFVYNFEDKDKQKDYFHKLINIENCKFSELKINIETKDDFDVDLTLKPVIANDKDKTPAVFFDIDIYQTKNLDIINIEKTLNKFIKYLTEEDKFLEFINKTFI